MSPSSEEFDIRDIAPEKPEGYDQFAYFPKQFSGSSASQLGQEILDHNFGEQLQALQFEIEMQGAAWGLGPQAASRSPQSTSNPDVVGTFKNKDEAASLLKMKVVGDRLTLSYDQGVNFRCDYSALSNKLIVSLNKQMSARSEVSLKHTSNDQRSSVNFNYNW